MTDCFNFNFLIQKVAFNIFRLTFSFTNCSQEKKLYWNHWSGWEQFRDYLDNWFDLRRNWLIINISFTNWSKTLLKPLVTDQWSGCASNLNVIWATFVSRTSSRVHPSNGWSINIHSFLFGINNGQSINMVKFCIPNVLVQNLEKSSQSLNWPEFVALLFGLPCKTLWEGVWPIRGNVCLENKMMSSLMLTSNYWWVKSLKAQQSDFQTSNWIILCVSL